MSASLPFATTRWTLVLRARGESPEARLALSELCEAYWMPVFRFLKREGRSEDAARELAQEFFARLLARSGFEGVDPGRGRFRSYLLGAVRHFLADVKEREGRLKRGAGVVHESLEAMEEAFENGAGGGPPADSGDLATDVVFDRSWAVAVMDRALANLESEFEAGRKAGQFAVLKGWLAGEEAGCSQAEAAKQLGLSEGAVKVAVHRMRKRFGELVRAELSQTLAEGADPEEELRYLVEVLARA